MISTSSRYGYANGRSTKALNIFQKSFNVALHLIRIILGLVFIFSGFVKAIDPLGTTYKFQDYFEAFGGFFVHLSPLALILAIALSTLELVIGLSLLFQIKLKLISWLSFIFILIMLPLTLYIAIKNPVTDCGCFGDALIISNWATFYKNVVLFILILLIVIFHKKIHNLFLPGVEWVIILIFILCAVGLSIYSYRHLPMMDFRPYKTGVNIPKAMEIPKGKPVDKYDTKLIYEKDGVQKEFTINNYPKDSTWKFVDQKTTLISKGYEPPIHNFTIANMEGADVTDSLLTDTGVSYLVVMYDVSKASKSGIDKAALLYDNAKANGDKFYVLTGSTDEDISNLEKKMNIKLPFYHTDPITLKTIVRSNPGFVKIENGNIIQKWNWRDFN